MYDLPPADRSESLLTRYGRPVRWAASRIPTPGRVERWARRHPRVATFGLGLSLTLGAATYPHASAAWNGHVVRYQGHPVQFGQYLDRDLRRIAPLPTDSLFWLTPVAATYQRDAPHSGTVNEFLDRLDGMPHVARVAFNRATLSAEQSARAAARHRHATLDLRHCSIAWGGLRPFTSKTNLHRVRLTHCLLPPEELAPLADAAGLISLDLSGSVGVSGGLAALAGHPALSETRAAGSDLNDASFAALVHCPSIASLQLDRTNVTDEGLAMMDGAATGLISLSLAHTNVSDWGVASMGSHPQLSALDLSGTNVTDAGLWSLVQNCPNLDALTLSGTAVSDEGLAALVHLPKLSALDLSETNVTDAGLAEAAERHGCTAIAASGVIECTAG
ncbi:leucine-rich repeat domain-containing protein [Alienimonas chondri]|uniref:Leucine Rich repeats (2 copies) n=1 Tax=Alienimonas chondri TaxID=2681879 RepID=A0ABX1VAK9_9PLAN|nr:hypothetical protein [Alienimonas chondri]NNJ25094.1 hypothetical protein [Alienimonas chondri]